MTNQTGEEVKTFVDVDVCQWQRIVSLRRALSS